MIYVLAVFGIAFLTWFCFVFDDAQVRLMFPMYRAFGLARNRESFARTYRLTIRAMGAAAIVVVVIGLVLR